MKNKKLLYGIIFIFLIWTCAVLFIWANKRRTLPCTQEAKLCPDGPYVGRTGPNCEFTPCPTTAKTLSVSVAELQDSPHLYNGKRIKTTGIWVSGFETDAFSNSTVERNGFVFLKEPAIWIHGNPITNKQDCFTVGEFPPATFCTVDVEGIFEAAYQFQIRGEIASTVGTRKLQSPTKALS